MDPLFRNEVAGRKRITRVGAVRLALPLSHTAITIGAAALLLILGCFLVVGHYTRRERVHGSLVPDAGVVNVSAPGIAVVSKIWVSESQTVKAGDPLVALSTERASRALGETSASITNDLNAARERLESDIRQHDELVAQHLSAARQRIGILEMEMTQLGSQARLQEDQVNGARAVVAKAQPLVEKHYLSELQIHQMKATAIDAEVQLKGIEHQRLDTSQQLASAREELARAPLDAASQRNDLEQRVISVRKELAENEANREIVLKALCDGFVSTELTQIGQPVSAGQVLLSIVPANSTLQAALLAPSKAIGFIKIGEPVSLHYEAYPYQKFGIQHGHVVSFSRNALTPNELQGITGRQSLDPFYRVLVALDAQEVSAYGHREMLKAGMELDADLMLDSRSLLEWLFEPAYSFSSQLASGGPSDAHL